MTQKQQEMIHLAIRGRVQGVGFRWFVIAEARRLDLAGWVRNNPDGSVELEAAGPPGQVQAFRERVAIGPRAARVDSVTEMPVTSLELGRPFDINR